MRADLQLSTRLRDIGQERSCTSSKKKNAPARALLGQRRYGRSKFPFPSPPKEFDHTLETLDSNNWAANKHPSLQDLLSSGVLTCVRSEQIKNSFYSAGLEKDTWQRPMPSPVYIVGTAHADQLGLSAMAVRRAVQEIRPANVVVELCRTRSWILNQNVSSSASSDRVPSEAGESASDKERPGEMRKDFSFSAFRRSLRLAVRAGGLSSGFLTLAMGSASLLAYLVPSGIRERLRELMMIAFPVDIKNTVWGEEFVVAKLLAEEIGANIVLGDRPIEITLARCLSALKIGKIMKEITGERKKKGDSSEAFLKVSSLGQVSIQDIGVAFRDKALSGSLLSSLADTIPELIDPLFTERDAFLAWSAIGSSAARDAVNHQLSDSTLASPGNSVVDIEDGVPVLIVCGAAHVRGVVFALTSYGSQMRWKHFVE